MSEQHDENVEVMVGPNWVPAKLADLLRAMGMNPEGYSGQFASMQAQIDAARADMQRQIDEIKSGTVTPAAQAGRMPPRR